MTKANENQLGTYLKDRRTKVDPAALGFPMTRRRTLDYGEEVAQQQCQRPFGTHGEQGRGGARWPRSLTALRADADRRRREHLCLVWAARLEARYRAVEGITPRLQRIHDVLEVSPALVRTATWDVVAEPCRLGSLR